VSAGAVAGPARALLRRFASIGLVATAVDVGLLVALCRGAGWPVLVADAVSISAAAVVSFLAHRAITFADDPSVRWVRAPGTFAVTAVLGGVLDVAVLSVTTQLIEPDAPLPLVLAKLPALALAAAFRVRVYRTVLFEEVRADVSSRVPRDPAPGRVRLSVVVPAYREPGQVADTVARLRAELAGALPADELEIVVVDDGSGDRTAEEARAAGADQVLVHPVNRGKGAAVRTGMLAAHGRTVAFTDADLSYSPAQLVPLVDDVEAGWDVVVGSRSHTETTTLVRARRLREIGGRVINRLTHAVLLGQYRDTQCGLKAFRSDVARVLFTKARVEGFAFDVEVFHLVERYHLSLTEVPVEVVNSSRSTVRVARDGLRLVRDLSRILRDGRKGRYDLTAAESEALAPAVRLSGGSQTDG
jgi:dolichyl-phosphate beta-glucosyltransferase